MGNAKRGETVLRAFALSYPGAYEDFPWGERVIKVGKKVFVFLATTSDGLHMSVKLPRSALLALSLPFASPTGYNLGRSGWVTARFSPREHAPLAVLQQWIDESYRAVAPKRFVTRLSEAKAGHSPVRRTTRVRLRPKRLRS
jgi:predicted DNA-binding protein (MmcQ/YjbR family)